MFKEDEKSHARDTIFGPFLEAQSQKNFIVAAEKEIHCTCTCEICQNEKTDEIGDLR